MMSGTRVVTFGEMLLRLQAPGGERFLQSGRFSAMFGGAEANVAVALASWGLPAAFVTALPGGHPFSDVAVAELRRHGVDVTYVVRRPGRFGVYFVEAGAGARPGRVVYDREPSAFSEASSGEFDWPRVFGGAGWFHLTGITPALSRSACGLAREAMTAARDAGLHVSFDLNYREGLWRWGGSGPGELAELARLADTLIANEAHLRLVLGEPVEPEISALAGRAFAACPNLARLAVTSRRTESDGSLVWSGILTSPDQPIFERVYVIRDVVDRIGAGDAFAAGLISSLSSSPREEAALAYASAAACLKHSIAGDFLRASADEIAALAAGRRGEGRIQR